jgi:ATP-dependent Clp protease ATP-binding subunit ClpA
MQNLARLNKRFYASALNGESVEKVDPGGVFAAIAQSAPTLALLNPEKVASQAKFLESTLRRLIIGHDEAIREIVRTYQTHLAGLSPVGRPIGIFLFLGPPASGKTRAVKAVAEALFGNQGAVTRIDCAEFQHSYEITKLIGSSLGNAVNREPHPLLEQRIVNERHTDSRRLGLLLLENVEKASGALWNRLLGILGHGTLILSGKRNVDLSKTLIFMTSTVVEMNALVSRKYGCDVAEPNDYTSTRIPTAQSSRNRAKVAHQRFTPEFLDRLDRIVVFKAGNEQLDRALDMELRIVQQRIQTTHGGRPFSINVSNSARRFLLAEGTDFRRGAQPLTRAVDRLVVQPLSNLITTGQIHTFDRIRITHIGASPALTFFREVGASEDSMVDWAVA